MRCYYIRVFGKVQGVSFRNYTKQKSDELALTGYVRNLNDKSVEILAMGEAQQLQKLLSWLPEGSPKSEVTHIYMKQAKNITRTLPYDKNLFKEFPIENSFVIIRSLEDLIHPLNLT